jgi:hypothetical protein
LAANAVYWFHDPRMMFEAAPAWALLAVLGVVEIVSWSEKRAGFGRRLGQVTSWAVVISLLLAFGWGIPTRWSTYGWTQETSDRIMLPSIPVEGPSLVFVHASWNERLSARLQGAGDMRQDSIVSALRRNTNCQLQAFVDAREAEARQGRPMPPFPGIDLDQAAAAPEGLIHVTLEQGMSIRTREGEVITPDCGREIEADRFGAVALAPLLWQGDLPGEQNTGPLFVRDLGPERNDLIRALFPNRPAFVFSPFAPESPPLVAPYDEAMRLLWGSVD